ncbi:hypothetical protein HDK77DRAFT_302433 [Phyllosticta capitalensis]|uniref:uncharacterized protein n=1 Tax=Phyllosticta capitalensis TaxID=121624 RepID=UPI00312D7426
MLLPAGKKQFIHRPSFSPVPILWEWSEFNSTLPNSRRLQGPLPTHLRRHAQPPEKMHQSRCSRSCRRCGCSNTLILLIPSVSIDSPCFAFGLGLSTQLTSSVICSPPVTANAQKSNTSHAITTHQEHSLAEPRSKQCNYCRHGCSLLPPRYSAAGWTIAEMSTPQPCVNSTTKHLHQRE